MLSASEDCLALCDSCTIANDTTVWLRSENWALTTQLYGKTSKRDQALPPYPPSLNDSLSRPKNLESFQERLFADIFFLNLHRQPPDGPARAPLFLEEIRSRFFATAYRFDKRLATTCGRPPRLSQAFCQLRLPLHIRNDLLVGPTKDLQAAIDSFGEDGWSSQVDLHPATWLHARSLFATLRERFLLIKHNPRNDDSELALQSILQDVHEAWNQLPSYLQYNSKCWDSATSPNLCFMFLLVYEEYLEMIFLTEELRYSFDSNNGSRLLIAAAAVLSAGISSSRHMSRSGAVYAGYAWMLLSFTLPSATLLATRLKDSAHLGSKALHPLSWQVVFHQLSALALDLETIAETLDHHDPGIEGGSTIVTNALDEALGARMAAPLAVQANPQSVDVYEPFPGNGLEH